jgi:hypothetical protein
MSAGRKRGYDLEDFARQRQRELRVFERYGVLPNTEYVPRSVAPQPEPQPTEPSQEVVA